jgi:hypothetical protein
MNRRIHLPLLLIPLIALTATSCGNDEPTAPVTELRILFLGNSLTETNNLPGMVGALGFASGVDIESDMVIAPTNLFEHLGNESTREMVLTGDYDFVILQQGPSSLAPNRESLRQAVQTWATMIAEGGARPALFAVWPESDRRDVFGDVSESYRLAAQDVNGVFLPVGDTWLEVWKSIPSAPFYSEDGYNPSVLGTYAAAVVIVSALTGRDATTLSPVHLGAPVDAALATAIRSAARTVLRRNGS